MQGWKQPHNVSAREHSTRMRHLFRICEFLPTESGEELTDEQVMRSFGNAWKTEWMEEFHLVNKPGEYDINNIKEFMIKKETAQQRRSRSNNNNNNSNRNGGGNGGRNGDNNRKRKPRGGRQNQPKRQNNNKDSDIAAKRAKLKNPCGLHKNGVHE